MSMFETLRSVLRFRDLEMNAATRRLAKTANVHDLRRVAHRRLPAGIFDYIDGGAEDETSLGRNSRAFRDLGFWPDVLNDVGAVDTSTTLLGRPLPIPLVLAPTGFTRIIHPEGERAVARAAARAGVPYTLSTLATRSIEEVKAASNGGELWFQVYVWRDRGLVVDMLKRASDAGYSTIVITVDTAVLGRRERDVRRGFSLPPQVGLDTLVDGMLHPSWTWSFLKAEPIRFANVGQTIGDGFDPVSLSDYIKSQFDPSLSWRDLEWFRERWDGDIVLKGIQTVSDARTAADVGVDGVALSNHGGRQLDGAPAPIDLVAPVADEIGDRVEVICDGGVRRGSDIVKAVAVGATACMVGRAYLYGLGAGGEAGVDNVLEYLRSGVERTMALCGRSSIDKLDRYLIRAQDD